MADGNLTPLQVRLLAKLIEIKRVTGIPPTIEELRGQFGFKSPRSVTQLLDALAAAGFIKRGRGARNIQFLLPPPPEAAPAERADTVPVPLIGMVAAGAPILAVENVKSFVRVSSRLARPPHKYFLLEVRGDSMDRAGLKHGDWVLVRQQPSAQPGDKVVALIDDGATVKVLRVTKDAVVLEPKSSNPIHKPIILHRDFQVQGVVVTAIESGKV